MNGIVARPFMAEETAREHQKTELKASTQTKLKCFSVEDGIMNHTESKESNYFIAIALN